jgi:hypothetical protein
MALEHPGATRALRGRRRNLEMVKQQSIFIGANSSPLKKSLSITGLLDPASVPARIRSSSGTPASRSSRSSRCIQATVLPRTRRLGVNFKVEHQKQFVPDP